MIAGIRPAIDFLRDNEVLLNDARPRADVILFLPSQRWIETDKCIASNLAAELTKANVQYRVCSEDDFDLSPTNGHRPVLVIESKSVLEMKEAATLKKFETAGGRVVSADTPTWLAELHGAVDKPSVIINGPPTVRVVVHDQPGRIVAHLYNLNIQRLTSFEDKVTPVRDLKVTISAPFHDLGAITLLSADDNSTCGRLVPETRVDGDDAAVTLAIPRLEISAIIDIPEK